MASFYYMKYNNIDKWAGKDTHIVQSDMYVVISDERNNLYKITLLKGFRCDGLSVPFIFQWFLPSWSKDFKYNIAGAIHDALYTVKGFGIFNRETCDDIFRSLLRDSGISRFKAGCADKAVEWFASSDNHWGNDSFRNKDYIKLSFLN